MISKLIVITSLVGLLIVGAVVVSLPSMKQITVKSKITE